MREEVHDTLTEGEVRRRIHHWKSKKRLLLDP